MVSQSNPASAPSAGQVSTVGAILDGAAGIATFPVASLPGNGVSIAEVLRNNWGALAGTAAGENGVITWPASAKYANGVSIAEAIGFITDQIDRGGTALPASQSLFDLLAGTLGVASYPASAAPANAVSIAAVLGWIADALSGTAGIPTWAAGAAAGNAVSISEALRFAQEAIRNGSGGTAAGTNKSIMDALGFDGVAAIAASAGMLRVMAGTDFVVKKTLTSSAILTTGVDVTLASTVGDVDITDVVVNTDGTGLAGGTNFTLQSNNAKGAVLFFSHAVASLGASASIDKKNATTGKTHILESGKKVTAICTASNCTGPGTIDVQLICKRLADNAQLAAA